MKCGWLFCKIPCDELLCTHQPVQPVPGNCWLCGGMLIIVAPEGRPCCSRWMLPHCSQLMILLKSVTSPPSALNNVEWLKVAIRCDFKLASDTMKSSCCCCCMYSTVCCEITCCLGTIVLNAWEWALPRTLNQRILTQFVIVSQILISATCYSAQTIWCHNSKGASGSYQF